MPKFNKDHAEKTAKKLKQKPQNTALPTLTVTEDRDSRHIYEWIWCGEQLVAKFGIKHGSQRNAGHGWVPRALKLGPHQAVQFANCTMTIDEMIEHLIAAGFISSEAL
jgi:hypothetical protein